MNTTASLWAFNYTEKNKLCLSVNENTLKIIHEFIFLRCLWRRFFFCKRIFLRAKEVSGAKSDGWQDDWQAISDAFVITSHTPHGSRTTAQQDIQLVINVEAESGEIFLFARLLHPQPKKKISAAGPENKSFGPARRKYKKGKSKSLQVFMDETGEYKNRPRRRRIKMNAIASVKLTTPINLINQNMALPEPLLWLLRAAALILHLHKTTFWRQDIEYVEGPEITFSVVLIWNFLLKCK